MTIRRKLRQKSNWSTWFGGSAKIHRGTRRLELQITRSAIKRNKFLPTENYHSPRITKLIIKADIAANYPNPTGNYGIKTPVTEILSKHLSKWSRKSNPFRLKFVVFLSQNPSVVFFAPALVAYVHSENEAAVLPGRLSQYPTAALSVSSIQH